jgi:hypothetical protein
MVELPSSIGPSLRGWLKLDATLPDDICAIGASALDVLRIGANQRVWVRTVPLRATEH